MKQNEEETSSMIEVGKAIQEVSKTTDHALHVAEKFGDFISRIIGGSLEQAAGIFEDKLKYYRWERQMEGGVPTKGLPDEYLQTGEGDEPELPPEPVQIGLWNRMRLGCIDSAGTWDSITTGIGRVRITALGKALFNVCSASTERG